MALLVTDDLLHQRLLYSLLQQFHEESVKKSESDEELQDSDLSMVAGGTGNHGSRIGCSKCDCPLMAQDIPGPLCKECGHSRGDHNECTIV